MAHSEGVKLASVRFPFLFWKKGSPPKQLSIGKGSLPSVIRKLSININCIRENPLFESYGMDFFQ